MKAEVRYQLLARHADEAEYPEKYSSQAIRLGIDYAVYAMTH